MSKEDQRVFHGGRSNPNGVLDTSAIKRKYTDLPYASVSEAQKLDIYLPENGEGPFPVIVFIHGGAFMMCDKADNQVRPYLGFLDRAYAVVSVNYRLSGEALFPAGILDVKAAIRFLRAQAERYHLDPRRFAAAGGSSGGNYAAMICAAGNRPELEDLSLGNAGYSSEVQAGVAWFPPTDFSKMDDHLRASGLGPADHNAADSPESRYLGAPLTELLAEKVQAANPMTYVHSGMPPLFLQHGRIDHVVPYQQSAILAAKIEAVAGKDKVRFEILEQADHADPLFETRENMEKVFEFINAALK
ncbi:MAG: alpha/beta hydrolase [Treponema sp.]|jgi:acetyl esterase/lipase|nr:alpha/beta hydrolase [Treponema sp.]